HGLRGAILQFEDDVDRLRDDIHRYARAWNVSAPSSNAPVIQDPERWVNEMFLTIPPSEDEADYTLEWIRDTMFEAARRHGCKYIILDPWNELSHIWDRHLTETAYTREALRQIKRWARQLQIAVIIVTHPTKAAGQNKPLEEWDLYSVEASNSWANKSDHGVVVWRETMRSVETYIKIAKSKDFRRMGMPGTVVMEFDQATSLYKNVRSA
ncbi:MAG: AAA family ATPase, partial [Hyphomicrobium sp.]